MGTRKKVLKPSAPARARKAAESEDTRRALGRRRDNQAIFPVAPPKSELPAGYGKALRELKQRIQETRLTTVLSANTAMLRLYWEIGRTILARQESDGWGAKVIDRLSHDLRQAFPDMGGLSPRNLKYMRALAAAWGADEIVQAPLARLPWYHHLALLEKLSDAKTRRWFATQAIAHGWSRNMLAMQIDASAHQRTGRALSNFATTLPPSESDLAAQAFKDPYLFDFLGTADPRREREVEQEQARCRICTSAPESSRRRRCLANRNREEASEVIRGQPSDDRTARGGTLTPAAAAMISNFLLGALVDRVHRELSDEDITLIADTYHRWRGDGPGKYENVPGFCGSVRTEEIRKNLLGLGYGK